MDANEPKVVVRRYKKQAFHGHHGGSWKIAYADFVTAMMAFFLLMWLITVSSQETKKGLAEYFTASFIDTNANTGSDGFGNPTAINQSNSPDEQHNVPDAEFIIYNSPEPNTNEEDKNIAAGSKKNNSTATSESSHDKKVTSTEQNLQNQSENNHGYSAQGYYNQEQKGQEKSSPGNIGLDPSISVHKENTYSNLGAEYKKTIKNAPPINNNHASRGSQNDSRSSNVSTQGFSSNKSIPENEENFSKPSSPNINNLEQMSTTIQQDNQQSKQQENLNVKQQAPQSLSEAVKEHEKKNSDNDMSMANNQDKELSHENATDNLDTGPSKEKADQKNLNVDDSTKEKELKDEDKQAEESAVKKAIKDAAQKEAKELSGAKAKLLNEIKKVEKFKDNVKIQFTNRGLEIQILDNNKNSMFDSGSNKLPENTKTVLDNIGAIIQQHKEKLSIKGHTDSTPYPEGARYDNWDLSFDRARNVHLFLKKYKVNVSEVLGKADTEPLIKDDLNAPQNRRISITMLYQNPQTVEYVSDKL